MTVNPRATRAYFIGALAIDLLLVFVLLCLTGGGDSVFYLLFFPLVAVNAYYFGPWVGLGAAVVAGWPLRVVDGAGAAVGRLDAAS